MSGKKVLIAYATTSGSTREIAERVGEFLDEKGLNVDVRSCREKTDLKDYDAIILGAPLYLFHLHKDAVHFLQRHQKHLEKLPVAIFAGGPYGPTAAEDALEVQKNLEKELEKHTWLQPVSTQLVGGRFDPALLRFPYNLIPAMKSAPACDSRNWEEIKAWAESLPELL